MPDNIVTGRGNDPGELAENRPRTIRNTPFAPGRLVGPGFPAGNTPARAMVDGSTPETRVLQPRGTSETVPIPDGTVAEELQELTPTDAVINAGVDAVVTQDRNEVPDWLAPSVLSGQGVRPLQYRPITFENPIVPEMLGEDDENTLLNLREQAQSESISDDVIYASTIRDRIAASDLRGRSTSRYAPVIAPQYDFVGTAADDIEERTSRLEAATTPVGIRPEQGMLGVGRNVLSGRPFSRISEQVIGDYFSRYGSDGSTGVLDSLVSRISNRFVRGGVENLTAGLRGTEQIFNLIGDIRQAERNILESESGSDYRTLGSRILDELKLFIAAPASLSQGRLPEARAMEFRASTYRSPLLDELAETSAPFRQLAQDLGPTLDQQGNLQTNPLRGDFGEFGNAGAVSGAMYLANIVGGAFTGAIYGVADDTRRILTRVNPQWAPPARSPNAVSPFLGVDVGFTQEYTPDRYLSTIGNPALRWMPRRAQIATGFALDIITGGAADKILGDPLFDALAAAARSGRAVAAGTDVGFAAASAGVFDIARRIDELGPVNLPDPRFAASLPTTYVRPTARGIESAATTAVMPTVNSVPAGAATAASIRRAATAGATVRRAAARGGGINTTEELVERVANVLQRIDAANVSIRQAEFASELDVRDTLTAAQRNYEATLTQSIRQVNAAVPLLNTADFQSFASGMLDVMRRNGAAVAPDGAITLVRPDRMMDELVAPIQAALSAPLYREYADVLDIYRAAPLSLPPQAFDLSARTPEQVVDLAKTWAVLPNTDTVSNLRVSQLRLSNPEFGSKWGSLIDENISAPIRRVIEVPESGFYGTPEVSRIVASPSPVSVDTPPAPDDILQRMQSVQRKYAGEVLKLDTAKPSTQRRVYQRMVSLRQEGAQLIADYPDIAVRMLAEADLSAARYGVTDAGIVAARTQIDMTYQQSVVNDLYSQLNRVNARVQEQQRLLNELPPLERRFVESELATRQMSGEVTPVRSVSTPSSISNETKYPAAREELFNNLDLLPGSGVEVTARELISQGELGTLPEQEALDIVRNMVEDGLLYGENTLDVFKNILSISKNNNVTLDTLITLPVDEVTIRETINLLPSTNVVVLPEGDIMLDSLTVPRREFLGYIELINEGIQLDYVNGKVDAVMPEQVARRGMLKDERLSELRYIGEGQYGTTYYDEATGTIAKYQKGSSGDGVSAEEVEFQRRAAAQGIAPTVFESINIDAVGRNFKQQFLDGYIRLDDVVSNPLQRVDPTIVSDIELKVYELLDRLHANGLVHNDLHGANIMVRLPTATEPLDVKLIDFGLAGDMDAKRLRDSLTDYSYTADVEFNRSVVYHGTHHTSVIPGDDVFSLSNEFGPAFYTNLTVTPAVNHAKALPSQDVVTTGSRTPRRESIGNVQAIILEYNSGDLNELPDALYYRDEIQRSMSAALKAAGEDRLRKNFNAWIKTNNNPANWWHYLRERYTDDRLSDLAKLQLDISDRLIDEGVRAFKGVNTGDYVIIDPSLIIHRSVPHAVDSTGTLAEGLAHRNAVDELLNDNLNNKTTQAIVAHNRLNMDTYIQNQLTAAVSQQEKETIQAIQQHYANGTLEDASFINRRSTVRAQWIDDLERQQNRTVSKFMEGLNDVCL